MRTLRLFTRLLFFVVYTTLIVAEIWLRNRLWGEDIRRSMRVRQRWARNLLDGVGLQIETEGTAPDFPCVIVSNHRSYIDPILILREVYGYPVAKAELANWPLIGKGAKMAGILYLRRESAGSRSGTLRQILEKIEAGFSVIIFPEGTTSGLIGTLPFKQGVFKLAAQASIPIVPVAIVFSDERDFWVGNATFFSHAKQRFGERRIGVKLCYGPEFRSVDPEALRSKSQEWIDAVLRSNDQKRQSFLSHAK
ncbi:MAG: 1-acyl-sn-glycerol-3-phosphate acyltransferase [Saprospiraceae bacterium]|nr:1-acyl-sn-glycerol-3-phosphate acyltransferase [Saprospiraceae bacterium]